MNTRNSKYSQFREQPISETTNLIGGDQVQSAKMEDQSDMLGDQLSKMMYDRGKNFNSISNRYTSNGASLAFKQQQRGNL